MDEGADQGGRKEEGKTVKEEGKARERKAKEGETDTLSRMSKGKLCPRYQR